MENTTEDRDGRRVVEYEWGSPHERQREFIGTDAKRIVIKAGRRSGKTVGLAYMACLSFLQGRRVLYATPTAEQIQTFWGECCSMLQPGIDNDVIYKNETRHTLEGRGHIRAKTAWDEDSLRGDFADVLCLDEFQLMSPDAWLRVGSPMLLDSDGIGVFCFTPPSIISMANSKAKDPYHANKLFEQARADDSGRWAAFHFTSFDNPHISKVALSEIAQDMTQTAYRQEILAESVEETGGIFSRNMFDILKNKISLENNTRVRHWDLASTVGAGDYTVGLLLSQYEDGFCIEDIKRGQWSPFEVERLISETAEQDGNETMVSLPQDPGQAGKSQAQHLIRRLSGYSVHARPETGSKQVRSMPVAAQAEAGNISLAPGEWNEAFLAEVELFPIGFHDDQVDALSGAFEDIPKHEELILWTT